MKSFVCILSEDRFPRLQAVAIRAGGRSARIGPRLESLWRAAEENSRRVSETLPVTVSTRETPMSNADSVLNVDTNVTSSAKRPAAWLKMKRPSCGASGTSAAPGTRTCTWFWAARRSGGRGTCRRWPGSCSAGAARAARKPCSSWATSTCASVCQPRENSRFRNYFFIKSNAYDGSDGKNPNLCDIITLDYLCFHKNVIMYLVIAKDELMVVITFPLV